MAIFLLFLHFKVPKWEKWYSEQRSRSKVKVIFRSRSPDVVYSSSIKHVQLFLHFKVRNGKKWFSEQRSRSKNKVIFILRSPDVVYLFGMKYVQLM